MAMPKESSSPSAGKPAGTRSWSSTASRRSTTTGSDRSATRSPPPSRSRPAKCTIAFDFAYDGGPGKGGTGTLTVNGSPVGEGRIEQTVPVYFSTDDTFDIGEDWGTPMSPTYEPPFNFTGILKKVTVQAKAP